MRVGAQDPARVRVENDGTVHLCKLEQPVGGEGNVDDKTAAGKLEDLFRIADTDKRTGVCGEDHIER